MSEAILKALMQLFALIGDIHDDTVITAREKNIVRLFLSRHLNNELIERYMGLFEEYLSQFNKERVIKGSLQDRKRTSLNAMKILSICERINEELHQKQKVYVLVKLVDFISLGSEITENELDFLQEKRKQFFASSANIHAPSLFKWSVRGSSYDTQVLVIWAALKRKERKAQENPILKIFK